MKRLALLLISIALFVGCLPKKPFGELYYIDSMPPEAHVFMLGRIIGQTPLEVELAPGSELTVKLDGYQSESTNTTKAISHYININLKKLYKIKLNYMPEGSEVWENGQLLGRTPMVTEKVQGHYKLLIRHEFHADLTDEFEVTSEGYRMKLLKPTVKYFPQTVCSFSSEPSAEVEDFRVVSGEITSTPSILGITPFDKTNAELSKNNEEHVFVFRKQGFAPAILTGIGSFTANIKLEPQIKYTLPAGKWFSELAFKSGQLASPDGSHILFAEKRDNKFSIISKKGELEVDILDMKTDYSDVSGAAWADDRFFVVRGKNLDGTMLYMAYDAQMRRKFRIQNTNIWHEAQIAGDIEWKQRVPVKQSTIESFADARIEVSKNFSVCQFRLFKGRQLDIVVTADNKFETQKLADCIEIDRQ